MSFTPGYISKTRFGPGTYNLQLLLDYEDWSAGDPLPNVYPDNSGITSLADNNTVGEETASPLVGSKSGDYEEDNTEYHSKSSADAVEATGDIYCALWFNPENLGGFRVIASHLSTSKNAGWEVATEATNAVFQVRDGQNSRYEIVTGQSLSEGTTYFIEGWITGTTIHVRVDDGTDNTKSLGSIKSDTDIPFTVGSRDGSTVSDGVIDNVLVEAAPQGELFWPSESTWLYNGGAGRSADEIKTYDP